MISDLGEGDVRVLLCNSIGKIGVSEEEALALFKMCVARGIISCYGIDANGLNKVEGIGPEEVKMRLIYDKPVFFVSLMAPPKNLFKEVREKLIKAKIAEKFKGAVVSPTAQREIDSVYPQVAMSVAEKVYCDECGEDGASHVSVDGGDKNLCEACCEKVSSRGHVVSPMNPDLEAAFITCPGCGFRGEPSEFIEDAEGQFYSCPRCAAEVEKNE